MRLKQLVQFLQNVPDAFPEPPKFELEQYPTPPDLAADIVYSIEASFGAFSGKAVADLGCGPGMLSFGAAAMGAALVVGFDIDESALASARATAEELELEEVVDFVRLDVGQMEAVTGEGWRRHAPADTGAEATSAAGSVPPPVPPRHGVFDTVVMNPPFGTRRAGADVMFLRAALSLATAEGAVYSLHKSSTREHLAKVASGMGLGISLVAQLRFALPATYAFHRHDSVDVAVDLLRFDKGAGKAGRGSAELPLYVEEGGGGGGRERGRRGGRR